MPKALTDSRHPFLPSDHPGAMSRLQTVKPLATATLNFWKASSLPVPAVVPIFGWNAFRSLYYPNDTRSTILKEAGLTIVDLKKEEALSREAVNVLAVANWQKNHAQPSDGRMFYHNKRDGLSAGFKALHTSVEDYAKR